MLGCNLVSLPHVTEQDSSHAFHSSLLKFIRTTFAVIHVSEREHLLWKSWISLEIRVCFTESHSSIKVKETLKIMRKKTKTKKRKEKIVQSSMLSKCLKHGVSSHVYPNWRLQPYTPVGECQCPHSHGTVNIVSYMTLLILNISCV